MVNFPHPCGGRGASGTPFLGVSVRVFWGRSDLNLWSQEDRGLPRAARSHPTSADGRGSRTGRGKSNGPSQLRRPSSLALARLCSWL